MILSEIFNNVLLLFQSSKDPVGFIGLGNMGAPMANNLLAKGYPLVVYDVIESCVEGAVKNGAVKASSPAEVRITIQLTFHHLIFFEATFRETPPHLEMA